MGAVENAAKIEAAKEIEKEKAQAESRQRPAPDQPPRTSEPSARAGTPAPEQPRSSMEPIIEGGPEDRLRQEELKRQESGAQGKPPAGRGATIAPNESDALKQAIEDQKKSQKEEVLKVLTEAPREAPRAKTDKLPGVSSDSLTSEQLGAAQKAIEKYFKDSQAKDNRQSDDAKPMPGTKELDLKKFVDSMPKNPATPDVNKPSGIPPEGFVPAAAGSGQAATRKAER